MAQKKRHPETVLHLEPKEGQELLYNGKLYAATLQVKAAELHEVEGDYEVVREVEPPGAA